MSPPRTTTRSGGRHVAVRTRNHRAVVVVRHPLYTGLLLAIYATAAAKGTMLGLLGALLVTLGLVPFGPR